MNYNSLFKVLCRISPADLGHHNSISYFQGIEMYFGGINKSEIRECYALDDIVEGVFELQEANLEREYIFRIKGMWDFYKGLDVGMQKATALMDTIGYFTLTLNGEIAFEKSVVFWNYRKWRFWPTIDIRIPRTFIQPGVNQFRLENGTPHFKARSKQIKSSILENTRYQISGIEILEVDLPSTQQAVEVQDNEYWGHLIIGHDVVHEAGSTYSDKINYLAKLGLGNVLVILLFPGKLSFDVDLDKIDVGLIRSLGLKVILRYYGNNAGGTMPEETYGKRIVEFVERCGDILIGLGGHEHHGAMARLVADHDFDDISKYVTAYRSAYSDRYSKIFKISNNLRIWDTDPSFFSRYHLAEGADFPATELCYFNANVAISSVRGTLRAFKSDRWIGINSFECQAFGGLSMRDDLAQFYPDFETQRERLWWVTQGMLYLGGARTIYSESGILSHNVTIQRNINDPHLQNLQEIQRDWIKFSNQFCLKGQPDCDIAYLQGKNDIYNGGPFTSDYIKACGESIYSWRFLEACLPNLYLDDPAILDPQLEPDIKRDLVSDTPLGDIDIVPEEASVETLAAYKLCIFAGWNTMDDHQVSKLNEYVSAGGNLIISLPQLRGSSLKSSTVLEINEKAKSLLCPLKFNDNFSMPAQSLEVMDIKSTGSNLTRVRAIIEKQSNRILTKQPYFPFEVADISVPDHAEVIIGDSATQIPLLIRYAIGRGSLYLFNVWSFPKARFPYRLINAFIKDIADGLDREVRLVEGKGISFYHYKNDKKLFAFQNEWSRAENESSALFNINGVNTPARVSANSVTMIETC